MVQERFGDVTVMLDEAYVATIEMHRPPENYFDVDVVRSLADAYTAVDAESDCRAILLCSEGKHFCAGANLLGRPPASAGAQDSDSADLLHREATRLFSGTTPVVAAIQGAAIGAGFGLACSADLRVACPESRFAANFARFGFHQVFGLTLTLPAIVGRQHAIDLLYTGRRLTGEAANTIGLCDRLVPAESLRSEAHALAAEIAACAPLAVRSIRQTMRAGMTERFRSAAEHESAELEWLQTTADWSEGVRAARGRRAPRFVGR